MEESQSLLSQGGAASHVQLKRAKARSVSIPLKSGRCCKLQSMGWTVVGKSQSL